MPINALLRGFRNFHDSYFEPKRSMFEDLVEHGQHPKVCVVACADSRVTPAIILKCEPGQIFEVRNVANIVPPKSAAEAAHSTASAIQYAVTVLKVEHILVLGHAQCGGIRALVDHMDEQEGAMEHVAAWIRLMSPARERVEKRLPKADADERSVACEQEGVLVSLENLMTYDFVSEAVESGHLSLHGWYLDIGKGALFRYDPRTKAFEDIGEEPKLGAVRPNEVSRGEGI
ncbi:MAG: carbonic anhydrase [Magnetovibrionaceae bacterium]